MMDREALQYLFARFRGAMTVDYGVAQCIRMLE
jgi:hypothetical protein